MDPAVLRFAATHEWLAVEGKIATVGISKFAVDLLSDLVFLQLPAAGTKVAAGDRLGEIESVKSVSDIYAPIGGTVVESNDAVVKNLDLLSQDPFGQGWLVKIELDGQIPSTLMNATAYAAHCQEEGA